MPDITEDDELITDLEAFHRELQASVGSVRDMVATWMPAQSAKNAFPDALENNEDFAPFRGRPERLGLGLEKHSSATTAAATAHPDSMEGKLYKGIIQSGKKRKAEESESMRSPAPVAKTANGTSSKPSEVPGTSNSAAANARADDDDDEESRTKSIKAKPNKASIPTNNFFGGKAASAKASATSAKKPDLAKTPTPGPSGAQKASSKPSASSAKDSQIPKAIPPSPSKVSPIKVPYAIPQSQLDKEGADDEAPSPSVDDSVVTEATESTQTVGTGETAKKKRKRNKKKKNKQAQTMEGAAMQAAQPDKLFGDSVIE